MIFVKLTNGNVLITTDGGDTVKLIQDTGVQVEVIGALQDTIQISQFGYPIYVIPAADVSATEVQPAAPIAFAGTASQLVDLLAADFFVIDTSVVIPGTVNVNVVSPNPLPVTGTLSVSDEGAVSTVNSTAVALGIGGTFTGAAEDASKYASIVVAALTDRVGTLQVQFSPDGVNWDSTLSFSVVANTNEVHRITVSRKYFRVIFSNTSGVAQTFLRLQTLLGKQQTLTSSLNSVIQSDADAAIVRPLDFNLMVAEGLYQNRSATTKEGINFDVDTGSVPEDLWDYGGTYTGFPAATAAAECFVPGADTGTVYYAYLASSTDTNYTFGSVAIAGAGTYALGHNIWRCNFAYFVAADGVSLNVSQILIRHTATPANIFVSIPIGYSQSYCAAYTVPFGAIAYIDRITANLRFNTSGNCDGVFWYKPNGESPRYRFTHEYNSNGLYFDDIDYLISIPALVDFIPRVTFSSANNLVCKVSYRVILRTT